MMRSNAGSASRAPRWLLLVGLAGPLGVAALWLLQASGALAIPATPVSLRSAVLLLVAAPVLEELAFRGALQDLCRRALAALGRPDPQPWSHTNLLTSIAFAVCHLSHHPPLLAASLLLPSLLLGRTWGVTGALLPCIVLHAWFNLCFLLVFTQWSV
jgi:membrane protease YdiL (CAAX protease family)